MITISSLEMNALLAAFIWPFSRIFALVASSPILGNPSTPRQIKIGLSVMITLVIAPALGPMPAIDPGSAEGLLILAQQVAIGLAMGFTIRIIFVAVDMAGELIGLQMGLGFATFFDPHNSGPMPVISRFIGIIATMAFLATDGHLQVISQLVQSFTTLPVGPDGIPPSGFSALAHWGREIFHTGLRLSLPVVAALLITNLALGILTRAAPQLNIFAVGFPLTLSIGLLMLAVTIPSFLPVLNDLTRDGLNMMLHIQSPVKTLL
jgi:flagellar biosynthesis protein FliR